MSAVLFQEDFTNQVFVTNNFFTWKQQHNLISHSLFSSPKQTVSGSVGYHFLFFGILTWVIQLSPFNLSLILLSVLIFSRKQLTTTSTASCFCTKTWWSKNPEILWPLSNIWIDTTIRSVISWHSWNREVTFRPSL
jgi:hypothetical protein